LRLVADSTLRPVSFASRVIQGPQARSRPMTPLVAGEFFRSIKKRIAVLLAFQPVAVGKNLRRRRLKTGRPNDVKAVAAFMPPLRSHSVFPRSTRSRPR